MVSYYSQSNYMINKKCGSKSNPTLKLSFISLLISLQGKFFGFHSFLLGNGWNQQIVRVFSKNFLFKQKSKESKDLKEYGMI